tara:strand:- start:74420 stop:74641 length:222 start_codon:yes stop_codon:yes gene_type:complete
MDENNILSEARERGFILGIKYYNTKGERYVSKFKPTFVNHSGNLMMGHGEGLIYDSCLKIWGRPTGKLFLIKF